MVIFLFGLDELAIPVAVFDHWGTVAVLIPALIVPLSDRIGNKSHRARIVFIIFIVPCPCPSRILALGRQASMEGLEVGTCITFSRNRADVDTG
jgi:hypothetical protein